MVEIVGELGAALFLALEHLGAEHGLVAHMGAQSAEQSGIFREALDDDVARALQCLLGAGDLLGDIGLRQRHGIGAAIGQDCCGQRAQAALAGNFGLGAALGLEGQIEIFEFGLGGGTGDGGRQRGRELVLLVNGFENGGAARFQLAQIGQPLGQQAQLRIVQTAGDLLAVARNEGHRRPAIEQFHRGAHLFGAGRDFCGDLGGNAGIELGHQASSWFGWRDHSRTGRQGTAKARRFPQL